MDILKIIVQGTDENKGYYVNGSLIHEWSSTDDTQTTEGFVLDIMLRFNIEKIHIYQLTEEGNRAFYENENMFFDEFSEYQNEMLDHQSVHFKK